MASVITEAAIRKAGHGLALSKIKSLEFSDRNLVGLNPSVMNQLVTLKTLDLSNNNICEIPESFKLPQLTTLDVSYNQLSSIQFIKNFPNLEVIYLAGNEKLKSTDLLQAVVMFPYLKEIDDQKTSSLMNVVNQTRRKFDIQVKAKWEVLFADKYVEGFSQDKVSEVTDEFFNCLKSDVLFESATSKFEIFMLKKLAEEMVLAAKNMSMFSATQGCPGTPRSARLGQVQSPDITPTRHSARTPVPNKRLMDTPTTKPPTPSNRTPTTPSNRVSTTPRSNTPRSGNKTTPKDRGMKRRRDSTPDSESKPRAKLFKTETGSVTSPKFTKLKTKENLYIDQLPSIQDYDPAYFVRCHSDQDDPSDCNTKVWRCAFEPKPNCPGEHTNIVATCGGKIVCLLDCQTGKVMRRFKDTDKKESFYSLAWTTIPVDENNSSETTNILAVAGDACDVKLIHPSQLTMYATMEGHRRYISCLTFHPSHPTVLFSGGNDKKIIVWDIGIPNLTDYSTDFCKLMVLQTPGTDALNLVVSLKTDTLLAGCENGCFGWKLNNMKKQYKTRDPDFQMSLPNTEESDDNASDKSDESNSIVDGMVLLPDDSVVTKCAGQSCLSVWDLKTCLPSKIGRRPNHVTVTPTFMLQYRKTTIDYINVTAGKGMVAVGDDKGCVHLYNIEKLLKKKISSDTILAESRMLEWPEVSLGRHIDSMKDLTSDKGVVINAVAMNHNQDFLVCGTDNNLVCIWRRSSQ